MKALASACTTQRNPLYLLPGVGTLAAQLEASLEGGTEALASACTHVLNFAAAKAVYWDLRQDMLEVLYRHHVGFLCRVALRSGVRLTKPSIGTCGRTWRSCKATCAPVQFALGDMGVGGLK